MLVSASFKYPNTNNARGYLTNQIRKTAVCGSIHVIIETLLKNKYIFFIHDKFFILIFIKDLYLSLRPVLTNVKKLDKYNKLKEGMNNHKERVLNLENAISRLPNKIGTDQLPKVHINKGITIKNSVIKTWKVTITL